MEWALLLKSVLSLVFVLGLLLLTLWAVKYMEINSVRCRFFKKLSEQRRLSTVELRRIDARNSVALVRCDDKEYLLLLGASNQVLDSKPLKNESEVDKNEK